jgi:hypothetical protein
MKCMEFSRSFAVNLILTLSSYVLLASSTVSAQPSMPPVVVYGQAVSGGPTILCRGQGCASILAGLVGQQTHIHLDQAGPLEEGYDSPFCTALNAVKPTSCSQSGPGPIAPGWSWSWAPATCFGRDYWMSTAIAVVLSGMSGYSNDINEPLASYDFEDACKEHDECWGVGFTRTTCNSELQSDLSFVCGSNSTCQSFASVYVDATSSQAGSDAYDSAVEALQCAEWHHSMDENNCPQND